MDHKERIRGIKALPCWAGEVSLSPLEGGITNLNFLAEDAEGRFAVRVGSDIPEHHVMRFNELSAMHAAYAAGVAPRVKYAEPSVTVLDFVDSHTLTPEDVTAPEMLPRIVELVKRCHQEVPKHLRGPALIFWVFHVIRDYGATLAERGSAYADLIDELVSYGNALEAAAGPFDVVFGHNDLLAGNILDDGKRLWLIDYDYAGFNSPLFDLGGLASNNNLSEKQEQACLEQYFEAPVTGDLLHRYSAMKCASLLRETMWSMVSELTSEIDFNYAAYTAENLDAFRHSYADFKNI
ncbi:choline kinase [Pseudorhodobacter turbinis]|uniref:Choline kinase n=1 Tax=Pseudorhodobacter turbinis TaxID=2500533 RepID=A0A4P8ECX1_9RHOB|nr:phosphotransferase [Pseudorhodobacter turbinis]QCO54740.1 choline kinase [Pseudorhodobacter turbinis]